MKSVKDQWSTVLAGKWNKYLLTPEWVAKHIFQSDSVEVLFPINQPDLAPRYRSKNGIVMTPATSRCQFSPDKPYTDEKLISILDMTKRLVTTLHHTPLNAMGINFSFEEETMKFGDYLSVFRFMDTKKMTENNFKSEKTELTRFLPINDCILRFTLIYDKDKIFLKFNYHYEMNITEILDILDKDLIINKRNAALEMIQNVYQLELDDDDDEEDENE